MEKVLSQCEIDELLTAISDKEESSNDSKKVTPDNRSIRIYDFKRADRFSKSEIRDISLVSDEIAADFRHFLYTEYDIFSEIKVASVDQLTYSDFTISLPIRSPSCSFEWLDGICLFQMDYNLFFYGFLRADLSQVRDLNGLEKKIFLEHIKNPFTDILVNEFSRKSKTQLPVTENQEFQIAPLFYLKNGNATDMGILITLKAKVRGSVGLINLFLSEDVIESLRETTFFSKTIDSKVIPLAYPIPNTIAEAGRFRLEDNFSIKKKMVFELNKLAGEPLNIYKNGVFTGQGESILIDDGFGLRVTTNPKKLETPEESNFYNAKVIYGSCTTNDKFKFKEGTILEFDENPSKVAKVVVDDMVVAEGEIVVVDENYGIKILKIYER